MTKAFVTYNFQSVGPPEQSKVQVDFDDLIDFFDLINGEETTPAQITANQNDYDPGDNTFLRLNTDASRTITGFSQGETGKNLYVLNVGSNDLVLANQSASSAAANRIITGYGANLTIPSDGAARLWYDSTTTKWRVINNVPATWS